jgi:hypothetical protein
MNRYHDEGNLRVPNGWVNVPSSLGTQTVTVGEMYHRMENQMASIRNQRGRLEAAENLLTRLLSDLKNQKSRLLCMGRSILSGIKLDGIVFDLDEAIRQVTDFLKPPPPSAQCDSEGIWRPQ